MKRLELIVSKNKKPIDIIEDFVNLANETRRESIYRLTLLSPTIDEREVSLCAFYNEKTNKLITTRINIYGTNMDLFPLNEELKFLLKNFGGKEFFVEYSHIHNRDMKSVKMYSDLKLNINQQLSAYLLVKEKKGRNYLNIGLHTGDRNRSFTLSSSEEEAAKLHEWSISLEENRPKGPFAQRRMSRINDYFQKYIEVKIRTAAWEIEWPGD